MPADLTARAIEVCQPHTEMLYVAIIRGEILAEHFDTLLRHPDEELRGKIADGIWSGHVRSPTFVLSDRWRQVVIRDFPKDLYLRAIFQADPTLRNEWLDYWSTSLCVKRSRRIDEETVEAAIEGLDLDEKRRLLCKLNPESPIAKSVIAKLAGEDLKLFQQLLGLQQLRKYHLRPLRRMPDKFWAELALVALKLGRSEYEVGVASGPGYEFEFRKESERKQAIIAAWNELRQHEDRRIRRIASRQWERSLDRKEDLLAE